MRRFVDGWAMPHTNVQDNYPGKEFITTITLLARQCYTVEERYSQHSYVLHTIVIVINTVYP